MNFELGQRVMYIGPTIAIKNKMGIVLDTDIFNTLVEFDIITPNFTNRWRTENCNISPVGVKGKQYLLDF